MLLVLVLVLCVCPVQQFLTRALMPLHKPKCVAMYHQQLAYCVTQVRTPVQQHSGQTAVPVSCLL